MKMYEVQVDKEEEDKVDDKGKEKVDDKGKNEVDYKGKDKAESTYNLIDVIILPIEDMFEHEL